MEGPLLSCVELKALCACIVISTWRKRSERKQGKRSKEESLTMEQKTTMVIRAVQNPCDLLYHGSITQEKLGGKGVGTN
jgi:hypothetical protein